MTQTPDPHPSHGESVELGKNSPPPPPPPPGSAGQAPPGYGAQQQPPPSYSAPGYPPPGQQSWGPPQPHGQPGYGQPPGVGSRMTPSEERTWGGAAHWSALVAAFVGLSFLGPLLVMVVKGNESPFVRRQAVESLNFQLTGLIAFLVSLVLMLVLIGFILIFVVAIMWLIFTVLGAVKASAGEDYRYPVNIRMVS